MQKIIHQIATEIKAQEHQIKAAVELLDGGATVPFIARYRKEATSGLNDIQLRELEYRLGYLRELDEFTAPGQAVDIDSQRVFAQSLFGARWLQNHGYPH